MSNEKNENSQNNLYWFYLIGFFLILALPILNLPPWFSPPDWGKTIVFRIILSVLLFLFFCQNLFQKESKSTIVSFLFKRGQKVFWPFWILAALLGIYFLATLFSLDARFSLWGSPYRSGGFVNFAFYIIFAILVFLILKQRGLPASNASHSNAGWQKIWDFSIIIGILVSVMAIFQWQGLFKDFVVTFQSRPPSTIGNPILLAIYLLLLTFLTLSFAIKEKKWFKKIFYLLSFCLFIFVILLTYTRAAYFGLALASLYFFFFYPFHPPKFFLKKLGWARIFKFASLIIFVSGIYGVYYVDNNPLPEFIQKNKLLAGAVSRLSYERALQDSRLSGWKVSWEALKERPILGYGPENLAIGFDKHYDPSLPGIKTMPGSAESWWDRAHNFVFDIAVTAGIPALMIYLALFGVLFWQLQRHKHRLENKPTQIIAHGLQTTFIGYLAANFFSFDGFSSYLVSFLLIGYSLNLITQSPNSAVVEKPTAGKIRAIARFLHRHRYCFIFVLLLCLLWFNWQYNIKPFQVNAQINIAGRLFKEKEYEQAFKTLDSALTKKSFLDNYLGLKYIDHLRVYASRHPDQSLEYVKKGTELLKENIKIRPYYVRNWLLLGGFMNVLISKETDLALRQELIKETGYYFDKARELSPQREEFFTEWCKYLFVSEQHQLLKENGEYCYPELIKIYQKSIAAEPDKPQHYASLAFIYQELGDLEKAKKQALKIIELFPEHKKEAEDFLKNLP